MQLYFTASPPKKSTTIATGVIEPTKVRSLDTYSKYKDITASSLPNTFSNRLSYFSGRTMFERVESGVIGCGACGLKKS